MKSEIRLVINRHPDEYNEDGYDIELTASTMYKGELFRVTRGGYADEVEKAKDKVIKALQEVINYTLFLRKKAKTVDEVIGVTVEKAELKIKE